MDFNNSKYVFNKSKKSALVENQGTIDVADGGVVALLGGAVKNTGTVNAHLGKIGFAGGERIVLSFGDNDFLRVEVPAKDLSTIKDANGNPISDVLNINGTVTADGGMVQLTVATAAKILRQRISMGGRVQVNTAVRKNGIIRIGGDEVQLNKDAEIIAHNGQVKIDSNTLTSKGVVRASGGNIDVTVAGDATLHTGASFDVSGDKAGKIAFTAGTRKVSRLKSEADFKADSTKGTGGYIDITAHKGFVWLVSGTLSAKGTLQGGRIRVGGAFQGGGYNAKTTNLDKKATDSFVNRWGDTSTLQSAENLTVEKSVTLNTTASAGYGGTVILWSDNATNNAGKIDARGVGDNGGSVEISGRKTLNAGLKRVRVDGGTLLLDPKNFTIDNSLIGNYKAALELGVSFIITASSDITVDAALDTLSDTGTTGKMTLIAGRSIFINQDFKVKGGLTLIANSDDFSYSGMTASDRGVGNAMIVVASGKTISGGDNDLIVKIQDGKSGLADNRRTVGRITVWKADGRRVSIVNLGTRFPSSLGEIEILDGGQITSTATDLNTGDVGIELKSRRFSNLSGADALKVNDSDGRYLVWTKHPKDNVYGKAGSLITSYDFAQFNQSYDPTAGEFQSNTSETTGTVKTGSGFIYSDSPQAVYTVTDGKTKVYDGNANLRTNVPTVRLKGSTTANPAVDKDRLNFQINGYSSSGDKYTNIQVTAARWDMKAKFMNTAGTAEQKDAGTNLKIRYSGLDATYKDANNKPVYGIQTKLEDVSGASITKKNVTINPNDFNPITKQYDNTGNILASHVSLKKNASGLNDTIEGDDVRITVGDDAFFTARRDVGSTNAIQVWKTDKITFHGTHAGNYKFNYAPLAQIKGLTLNITPKVITLKMGDYTTDSKVYDGTKTVKGSQIKLRTGAYGFNIGSGNNQVYDDDKGNVTLHVKDGAFKYASKDVAKGIRLNFADTSKLSLIGAQASNYKLATYASNTYSTLTAEITKKTLTINANDFQSITKVYDANKSLDTAKIKRKPNTSGLTGVESGDVVTPVFAANALSYNSEDAGDNIKIWIRIVPTLDGADAGNYKFSYSVGNFINGLTGKITKKVVTLKAGDFNTITKTYDGGTSVAGSSVSLKSADNQKGIDGVIGNQAVTLSVKTGALVYASKNVHGYIQINVADNTKLELSGADAKNYKFSYAANADSGLKGIITKKTLTLKLADLEVLSRNYVPRDKSATVVLKTGIPNPTGLNNTASGDDIKVKIDDGAFEFHTADMGGNKRVNWKIVNNVKLAGADKDNYTLDLSSYKAGDDSTLKGGITYYVLTLTANVQSRTYNGKTALTIVPGSIKWTTDSTTMWLNGETDKSISSVTQGNLVANAEFKNAGKRKVVFSGKSLTTAYKNKGYKLAFDVTKTVIITPKMLTLKTSDFRPITKTYDGDNKITGIKFKVEGDTMGLDGAIPTDEVELTIKDGALVYANEDAGGNKRINIADRSKLVLTGRDAGSYIFSNTVGADSGLRGTITKAVLTVTADVADRAYDGTKTNFTLTNKKVSGWIGSEGNGKTLSDAVASGSLKAEVTNKNASDTAKSVTLSGLTLKTTGVYKNYQFTYATDKKVKITKKTLIVTANVADRIYDGSKRNLTLSNASVSGWIGTDSGFTKTLAAATQSGTLVGEAASKNVGTRAVTFSGLTIKTTTGTYGNYKFEYATDKTVKINEKEVNLKWTDFTVASREYDGTGEAPVTVATGNQKGLNNVVSGDKVTLSLNNAFSYNNFNVEANKAIRIQNIGRITLQGDDAGNYKWPTSYSREIATPLKGTITQKILTLKASDFQAITKIYDGGTAVQGASVKLKTADNQKGLSGVVGNDKVTLTIQDGAFVYASTNVHGTIQLNIADKNKLRLSGTHAGNYKFTYATNADSGLTGAITQKTLTLKASDFNAISKIYDGNTSVSGASVTLKQSGNQKGLTGVIGNDVVALTVRSGALVYADKNVSAGNIQLNIGDASQLKLGGADAGNYKFSYTAGDNSGLSGKITKKTLTLKLADLQVTTRAYKAGDKSATVTVKTDSGQTGLNNVVADDAGNVGINIAAGTFEFHTDTKGRNKQVDWKNKDRITLTGSAKGNYTLDSVCLQRWYR